MPNASRSPARRRHPFRSGLDRTARRLNHRRGLLESLESRQLLSADGVGVDPLTELQEAEIDGNLTSLVSFADRVEQISGLDQSLDLVGGSFNERIDFSDVLDQRFATPLLAYIGTETSPTTGAIQDFISNDLAGTFGDIEFAVGKTELNETAGVVFDTTLYATRTVDYTLTLGDEDQLEGVSFSSETDRSAEFAFAFDLQFGVDHSNSFFATIDSLEFSVSDTTQLTASDPIPDLESLTEPLTLSILVNDDISVQATLPAHVDGNQTPVTQRLQNAFAQPLDDAGLDDAIEFVDAGGNLAIRAVSADVQKLQVFGKSETQIGPSVPGELFLSGAPIELLGFSSGDSTSNEFLPNVDAGLIGLHTTSGGIAVNAGLDVRSILTGRLTATQLATPASLRAEQTASSEIELQVTPATGQLVAGPPTIEVQHAGLFGSDELQIGFGNFEPIEDLQDDAEQTLLEGFESLTEFGARLETESLLSSELPALNETTAGQVNVKALLRDKLQSKVEQLLANETRPTWEQVRETLAAVEGVTVSPVTKNEQQVSLDVTVSQSTSSTVQLALGDEAEAAGLAAGEDALPEFTLQSEIIAPLTIEIDRAATDAPLDAFAVTFGQPGAPLQASVSIDNQPVNFAGRVGFLGVDVAGAANADASVTLGVQAGSPVRAADLASANIISTGDGNYGIDLNVSAEITGQALTGSLGVSVSDDDVFGGVSQIAPVDFSALEDFANTSASSVAEGVSQIASWLGDFAGEELNGGFPLAAGKQFSDVVDLQSAFEEEIESLLKDDEGQLQFTTLQELVALSPMITNAGYSAGSRELTVDFEFGKLFEAVTADLSFDVEIGDFTGLSSDAMLSLVAQVDGKFQLGIDLSPIGEDAAPITRASSLVKDAPGAINAGMGVMIDDGDDVKVTLRDSSEFFVSFDGMTNLGQVIDALDALSPNLMVEIRNENGKGVGLELTDTSEGDSLFSVQAAGSSLAGLGLGILGQVEDAADEDVVVIEGLPLHGDTIAHHLFIAELDSEPIAKGMVALTSGDFDATANLGFTEVTIQGGGFLPSSVTASVGLPQPKMTLADLFASLEDGAGAAQAIIDGLIQIELPTFATVSGQDYGQTGDALVATISDFGGIFSSDLVADLSGTLDAVLEQLANVDAGDLLDGLRDGLRDLLSVDEISIPFINVSLPDAIGVGGFLDDLLASIDSIGSSTLDILSEGIDRLVQLSSVDPDPPKIDFPEIDVALPDLFAFFRSSTQVRDGASGGGISLPDLNSLFESHFNFQVDLPDVTVSQDDFNAFLGDVSSILDSLQLSGPGSLQGLEAKLEEALGLGADAIGLSIDTSVPDQIFVRFDLDLGKTIDATYPLAVDLSDLDLGGIGDLVDVSGSSTVMLSAGASAKLSLGVEVSSAGVKPFLYTDAAGSLLSLTASASAADIDFEASLGPLGIEIVDGNASIGPATFELTFDGGADQKYFFLDETLELQTVASGTASATLPIQFPIGDPVDLVLTASDLTQAPTFNTAAVKAEIEDRIASLGSIGENFDLLAMVGGWEGAFDLLTETMRGEVLGVPLPLIGDKLADEADFLDEIKEQVLLEITDVADQGAAAVQQALFSALGPDGIDLLIDSSGDKQIVPDINDVIYNLIDDGDGGEPERIEFDVLLGKAVDTIDIPLDFDLGLPGLNFDIDAPVMLDFGFDFGLGFGVSLDEGFYFNTDDTSLDVYFDASVPEFTASGQLALLEITATNGDTETRFDGDFAVSFTEPSGDDRLTLSEMFAGNFSEIVQHELTATAHADLHLVASIGDSSVLPRLRTNLMVDWGFGSEAGAEPLTVEFTEVEMNLGDFFGGFAGDVLGRVQDVLEPVQPVINVLQQRLPVISDLGGRDVTLLDVARVFGNARAADFIQSVIDVNNLITSLPDPSSFNENNEWVGLGQFSVGADALGAFTPGETAETMTKELTIPTLTEMDPLGQVGSGDTPGGGFKTNLNRSKGSLSFPLLTSPASAFQLLLGKDVDLFLYDAPKLDVGFRYNQSFPTPIPALFANIGGSISASADFAFGYDTTGIRKFRESGFVPDIFDGFFVSDRINADGTGADVAEVVLKGSLTAGASLNVLIAEAGVRGGIFADVNFNLHDNDRDGKVRAGELLENLQLGPIHVFDVSGGMDAGLDAFYRVLFFYDEFQIARKNLLNFEIARPAANAPSAEDVLTSRAGDVLTIQFTQGNDDYQILEGSQPGSIVVQGQGMRTKDIVGITSINGNALGGNDSVTISNDVALPVSIDGGAGNDQLSAGSGPTTFIGGSGNDQLTGGGADDDLRGGEGDDTLTGGDGNDMLDGGLGNDYLDGGRNSDTLRGGEGDDQLFGGFDADDIDGEAGADVIQGGRGNDLLKGGAGADDIEGGRGNDVIDGGADDDRLFGQEGEDEIDGGEGNDEIDGGERVDTIRGGGGDDWIRGGSGSDDLSGDGGDDVIRGGTGADNIDGGAGNDLIFADEDELGGVVTTMHEIFGGAGNDVIWGSVGVDLINAGDGNDAVQALAGDDVVVGGLGDDDLNGGDGNDIVWGGVESHSAVSFQLSNPSLFQKPPRYDEATGLVDGLTGEAGYSGYSLPVLITPTIVGGQSVDGNPFDGNDTIRGGAGTDWLFGGSESDAILGGDGPDYIDGGSGNDANLFGDDGDDVIRGGLGVDVIHGGLGIDQIYGDAGRDKLYGDGGVLVDDGNGNDVVSIEGQRLFGGDDADELFAWSEDTTTVGGFGDQLFGGNGSDFLYGNLRNELLFGESGPDFLSGDWAAGPDYNRNTNAAILGGDDFLSGGGGQDQAYGGGGDDWIIGGGDGDWLEGQDGMDVSLGGGGIDFLVLDVDPTYSVLGGETLDGHGDPLMVDDNATDVMLINGTAGDDVIRLRQSIAGEEIRNGEGLATGTATGGRLLVEYGQARIEVVWQADDAERTPLVEQFRIDAGAGDDWVVFEPNENALDVSQLTARSRDWVTQIYGGPGDDALFGSAGRDRIDGGRNDDVIVGVGGDDRLWGDNGDGAASDFDQIFAGQGNDDVLGGQGTNKLYAWSFFPGELGSTDFGVFADEDGMLFSTPGPGRTLEDTGLNRIIGGPNNDELFGGTGLDLLYGADGNNQLFTRTGMPFEDLDGGDAGDAWKEYAKSTDQAWYVGGTNASDLITVSFVTEPGILQGHHLVTRLTNNNGSFSFDAQVRLDFAATDDDGNLVWDPDLVFAGGDLDNDDPFARAEALNTQFTDRQSLSRLLPPEDDFRAIIVDALGGDDIVNVGPTVQKTVWVDAGDGNDTVTIASGRSILIDKTDPIGRRNDTMTTEQNGDGTITSAPYSLAGPASILGENTTLTETPIIAGRLARDASFFLIIDDLQEHVQVSVPASMTDGIEPGTVANETLDDLVDDVNRAIAATKASGRVIATRAGDAIALSSLFVSEQSRLAISISPGNAAHTELGLPEEAFAESSPTLSRSMTFAGLTIDSPDDVDYYRFTVPASLSPNVTVASLSEADGMSVELTDEETNAGLTNYLVRVESDSTPTIYELQVGFDDGLDPLVSDLSAEVIFERQDVIFGGPGNDVLQGGPGEDFVFGGPGRDVLTGGDDRGASDLLFGQAGDDLFQVIPGGLPVFTGTSTTFLPTQSDRFDGGIGQDNVVYLGTDHDDLVSIRSNRLLGRYEVSDLVYDTANERFTDQRRYHFFTTVSTEQAVFDLQDGDDQFRGDAGPVFPNDASEWGFSQGDLQATGGSLLGFRVSGGDGNDQLVGTPFDDILIGGNGDDSIRGGLGNDLIDGGNDRDSLFGNQGIVSLTTLEEVDIQGANGPFTVAELPILSPGQSVIGLLDSDQGGHDRYLLRAVNEFAFSTETTPAGVEDRIKVFETNPDGSRGNALSFVLTELRNVGTESQPEYERFQPLDNGVADAFLLVITSDPAGRYEVVFESSEQSAVDVSVDRLTQRDIITDEAIHGFTRSVTDLTRGAIGTGFVLPAGDFDADGVEDHILSIGNTVFLYYGGDNLLDPTELNTRFQVVNNIFINANARELEDEFNQTVRFGQSGDFDGDGADDLILTGYGDNAQGTQIVFGEIGRDIELLRNQDPDRFATVTLAAGGTATFLPTHASSIGDVNGDGIDDVLFTSDQQTHVVYGRARSLWQSGAGVPQDQSFAFNGHRVMKVGDIDGDTNTDLAVISDQELFLMFGDGAGSFVTQTVSIATQSPNDFAGSEIIPVGDATDPSADFLISGPTQGNGELLMSDVGVSFLVSVEAATDGSSLRTVSLNEVPIPNLRPIGDFSGDGRIDFAASRYESDGLVQNRDPAPELYHHVTHVYLSDDPQDLADRLSSTVATPHLVLEKPDALRIEVGDSEPVPHVPPRFNSLGDINGDGLDDLALFSAFRKQLSVVYGSPVTAIDQPSSLPTVPAASQTLNADWDVPLASSEMNTQPGIDIRDVTSRNLAEAVTINGGDTDLQIDSVRPIGDINGDGFMDMVVGNGLKAGVNFSSEYLVLGPFEESGEISIDQLSNLVFRPQQLTIPGATESIDGSPIKGSGNLVGDELDDVIVYRNTCAAGNCTIEVEAYAGGDDIAVRLANNTPTTSAPSIFTFDNQPSFGQYGVETLNWDGEGITELLVSSDNSQGSRIALISLQSDPSKAVNFIIDYDELDAPDDTTVNSSATFSVSQIGDINGDGKDDIAFASPDLYSSNLWFVEDVGAVFVVLGGLVPTEAIDVIDLATMSDQQLIIQNRPRSVTGLGDLDGDGYDDFIVERAVETQRSRNGQGILEVYRGSSQWGVSPVTEPWAKLSQDLLFFNFQLRPDDTLSTAAGDLDGDGKADLVVGIPSVTTFENAFDPSDTFSSIDSRGQTYFFSDIVSRLNANNPSNVIYLDSADQTYSGVSPRDHSGSFGDSQLVDLTGDGLDDLWIGASGEAASTVGGADAGQVRLVPGRVADTSLPNDSEVSVLQNRGRFVADDASGSPLRFQGDDFRLDAQQSEKWFRLTMAGDGFESNYVRVDAPSGYDALHLDWYDSQGRELVSGKTLIDLRNSDAGTYFVRVSRRSSLLSTPEPFAIEINAPAVGQFHSATDRDYILGGPNIDYLDGGPDQDRLAGQEGDDVIVGDHELEAIDLSTFSGNSNDQFSVDRQPSLGGDRDPVVPNGSMADPLKNVIATQLGHPVTTDGEGNLVLHEPWRESDLAQIESISLSGTGLTNDGLFGITLLPNLRSLDLSNNSLAEFPRETLLLTKLERLILDGNPITDLSPLAGMELRDLEPGFSQDRVFYTDESESFGGDYHVSNAPQFFHVNVPEGEFEVFVTVPQLDQFGSEARFRVTLPDGTPLADVTFDSVLLTMENSDDQFGNRPWKSLGRHTTGGGSITIVAEIFGRPEQLIDAIRVQTVNPTLGNLQELSLIGLPLDAISHDEILPRVRVQEPELEIAVIANANSPTIQAIPTQTISPVDEGQALSLSDSLVILDPSGLDGLTNLAVDFWFKNLNTASGVDAIFSAANPNNDNGNEFTVWASQDGAVLISHQERNHSWPSGTVPPDNEWHHYAVVRDTDNGLLRLFIDGQAKTPLPLETAEASDGRTPSDPLSVTGLVIGQDQDVVLGGYSTNNAINGVIDRVRIWDKYWSDAADLQARMTSFSRFDPSNSHPDLRKAYEFDEYQTLPDGTVQTLDSKSGNFEGQMGNQSGTATQNRPAPLRVDGGVSYQTHTVLLQTDDGTLLDEDGHPVTFSAESDRPDAQVSVSGETLTVSYLNVDSHIGSTNVTVTASDGLGRSDRTRFGFNVVAPWNYDETRHVPNKSIAVGEVALDNFGYPFAGSTIQLLDENGALLTTTYTDHDGRYFVSPQLSNRVEAIQVVLPTPLSSLLSSSDTPLRIDNGESFVYGFEHPAIADLDGNGSTDLAPSGEFSISNGIATLGPTAEIGQNEDTDTAWFTLNPTHETGYTVDLRVKLNPDANEGAQGTNVLAISAEGTTNHIILYLYGDDVRVRSDNGIESILNASMVQSGISNTDDFHSFRVHAIPGTDQYLVYRDGVLLNDGNSLTMRNDWLAKGRFLFGAGHYSTANGETELDSIRMTRGLAADLENFEHERDITIDADLYAGPNRVVQLGETATFTAISNAVNPGITWDISGPNANFNVTGATATFEPLEIGNYALRASRNVGGDVIFDDLAVVVVAPQPVISLQSSGTGSRAARGFATQKSIDHMIDEGGNVDLEIAAASFGLDASNATYQQITTDSNGEVVQTESISAAGLLEWTFTADDEGDFAVIVTGNDGSKTVTSEPFLIRVLNVEPTVVFDDAPREINGQMLVMSGSFTDPGNDLWLGTANFGDGTQRPIVLNEDKTFSIDHQYQTPGRYQVTVTIDDQDGTPQQAVFDVTYDPEIKIDEVIINDGDDNRSAVTSVDLTFNQIVEVPLEAFALRNKTTGETVDSFAYQIDNSSGVTAVELTFLPGPSVVERGSMNSLSDGNYELVISSSGVTGLSESSVQMARDFVFGDNATDDFFRLLGDSDGDRDVDGRDYGRFGLSFLKSEGDVGFNPVFDSDGDGDVDGRDYGQFGLRFLQSLGF